MNTLLLLLTVTSTLVLRSGDRITVEGPVREENGAIMFRSEGVLYRLSAKEVERIETGEPAPEPEAKPAKATTPAPAPIRLRVTEAERKRLIAELEKNHSGQPPAPNQTVASLPPAPTAEEASRPNREEWDWRRDARAREEAVRRAQEELQLLLTRVEELKAQIHSFISLGYKPSQFTYQTSELARVQEQIPYARLEVTRAQRENEQFREDARRQGILPGWLR